MSGQSITDRITAAQHSVTGSAVSKTVCKATTHEIMGPKKKHLDWRETAEDKIKEKKMKKCHQVIESLAGVIVPLGHGNEEYITDWIHDILIQQSNVVY
ncbi:hypothetical protein SKAU_G00262170 [Synaphobranchus kaupii]|uniref:Uncharacterized protein n=1 Tax=Synaphobranchus kaupii TaxID=118154 RepID=A0A9Q1EYP9_SYNKA|nr:hypothetical protein SKAU_G00262170 [Synaphobranchus kaupii]